MKIQNIDFVIVYEVWQRELYGCTLLKLELEKRGYSVRLDHFPNDGALSPYRKNWAPKVVINPFLYTDACVKQAIEFGKKPENIINLQSEQILSDFTVQWRPKMPVGNARKGFHACWGEVTRDRMEKSGVPAEQLKIVGNIHLDINREEYRSLFPDKKKWAEKYDLDPDKTWIMFFSNFKFSRMDQADIDEYIAWCPKHLKDLARLRYEEAKKEADGTLAILYEYVKKHPEVLIIYRYHPAEMKKEEEIITKMKEMSSSFRCINDGTIQDWIPACDMFLTTDSTSMSDVIMQNKPFGLFETTSHDRVFIGDTYLGAKRVRTLEDLEYAVENKDTYYPLVDGIFEKNIINTVDGRKAYENLADWAEEIYKNKASEFVIGKDSGKLSPVMKARAIWRNIKTVVYRNPVKKHIIVPNLDNEKADTARTDRLLKKIYSDFTVEKHRKLLELEKAYDEKLRPYFQK